MDEPHCTICLELFGKEITTTSCNHTFHTACLGRWTRENRICPFCRTSLEPSPGTELMLAPFEQHFWTEPQPFNLAPATMNPTGHVNIGQLITVPLQFWFNRDPRIALPVVWLPYNEVRINIDFRPLEELLFEDPLGPDIEILDPDLELVGRRQTRRQRRNRDRRRFRRRQRRDEHRAQIQQRRQIQQYNGRQRGR